MKRHALEELIAWKQDKRRKPLIIEGARQVGKTWLMREFARVYYKRVVYINFDTNDVMRQVFETDKDVHRILRDIGLAIGEKLQATDTVILLDEIQECPAAVSVLKYFHENAPQYHIIGAGSLLGVALAHQGVSFPVGKVNFLKLHPLSFSEYMAALGQEDLLTLLQEGDILSITALGARYEALLKQYLYVGGMPEAVAYLSETQDLLGVRTIQNEILNGYTRDFAKHIRPPDIARLHLLWQSIPVQLGKGGKFVYSRIQSGARAASFESAMSWLVQCGLIYRVHNVTKPALPLAGYTESSAFKLYMLDTGLLGAMSHLSPATLTQGNAIFQEFKGALTEQFVLQELSTLPDMAIAYWSSETAEIDFVIESANQIIPIEVKSTINLQAKSMKTYRDQFAPPHALRTSLAPYRHADGLYDVPLYMLAAFLLRAR